MNRVVFLLEEQSMKVLLDGLLPRLYPELQFICVPHEGKQDLERSVPRKLRAWREPGVRFCVIRDNDGSDCVELKQHLLGLCGEGGRQDTLVRIACQELEAWYFGAPDCLAEAFDDQGLKNLRAKARFRDPDAIPCPANALAELVPAFQKVSGARSLSRLLSKSNDSRSFQVFIAGLDRLSAEMSESAGDS